MLEAQAMQTVWLHASWIGIFRSLVWALQWAHVPRDPVTEEVRLLTADVTDLLESILSFEFIK